jgi:hypothetical protein
MSTLSAYRPSIGFFRIYSTERESMFLPPNFEQPTVESRPNSRCEFVCQKSRRASERQRENGSCSRRLVLVELLSWSRVSFIQVAPPHQFALQSRFQCFHLCGKQAHLPGYVQLGSLNITHCFVQAASAGQRRFLSINEYQSMTLLNSVCIALSLLRTALSC